MSILSKTKVLAFYSFILFPVSEKVNAISEGNPIESIGEQTIILPRVYKPLEFKSSFSILFTKLPMDWVETSVEVPILQFDARLGLPAGFTIDGNVESIWVSNRLSLGPHWNIAMGKFSFGAGFDASFMYGKMTVSGFDNEAWGWGTTPNFSVGFKTKDIAFTIKGELKKISSLKITSGSTEISNEKNFRSGWAIGFYVEQPLWKDHVMVMGLINNFQKFYYAAWPAFSAFNRQYYIPQIYIGLVL